MNKILLLDDDKSILEDIVNTLSFLPIELISCTNAKTAEIELLKNLSNIKFAIIDLFLNGASGAHLSNNFIKDFIIPNKIPYCRLTSAPSLVPKEFSGKGILNKRDYYIRPEILIDKVLEFI